jgi:hypothetical protein
MFYLARMLGIGTLSSSHTQGVRSDLAQRFDIPRDPDLEAHPDPPD